MKKHMSFVAIILIASIILSGCSLTSIEDLLSPFDEQETIVFTSPEEFTPPYSSYFYGQLSEEEKYAYIALYEGFEEHREEIPVVKLEDGQISNVYTAVINDNPQLLCVDEMYTFTSWRTDICTINPTYNYPQDECSAKTTQMLDAAQSIVEAMPAGYSDYEKELYLHDYLVTSCYYDELAYDDPSTNPDAYTAYGALVDNKALCGGYTYAYSILLSMVDIDTYPVYGTSNDDSGEPIGHVWNAVLIDGKWYHVDVTFDDPIVEGGGSDISHAYFNVPTSQIAIDHIINPISEIGLNCISKDANYFVMSNLYFDYYDDKSIETITNALSDSFTQGKFSIEFMFSSKEIYDACISEVIDNGYVHFILEDAVEKSGVSINSEEVYYTTMDDINLLKLEFTPA